MRCGKPGIFANRMAIAGLCVGLMAAFALLPARAQQIHRNGFEGRQTTWLRGEDNVRAEEKSHTLSNDYARSGSTSEFIQLVCLEGKNETNFANYYYPTQAAPIGDDLVASVYVKANRSGIQLQARLVLPKERNPKQIDEPMTVVLNGDTYRLARRWQKLEIPNAVKLAKDQQQVLRLQLGRDIDLTDAYVDRLVLNCYTGAGQLDAYIDDLEIGPVKPILPPPTRVVPKGTDGTPTAQPKLILPPPIRNDRGIQVRMEGEKLFVGGKPFFFRAIRYTDTPLKTLRDAGFNTVWFDINQSGDKIEEAIGHGFWIVPSLPLLDDPRRAVATSLASRGRTELASARDLEQLGTAISRFVSGDSVLFWDIGSALQIERADQLKQMADAIWKFDPHRPRGADIWDGFGTLSNFVEMSGTHRYPLLTSLELTKYRDWLVQRRQLTTTNSLHWTWVQTHIPDWQTQVIYGKKSGEGFDEPIGPQPEQIRLLTYLGMSAGCRGLAFSSDRFLADSHQGRDRLLMMAMLNQEIHMLEPILLSLREPPTWIDTSSPYVKAAVLRSEKGILVMPIWLGNGAQFVPPQGAIPNLTMVVPLVPDGAQPWEITPARVQSLQFNTERKLAGTRITLPEFDLTSAIVFTSDLTETSMVVKWQNHSRLVAPQAAQWAKDLATLQLQKVRKTHEKLADIAPPIPNADDLLKQAADRIASAQKYEANRDYANAYLEAIRALRPLRVLMRVHWEHAIRTLDLPSASPFAVSFYTLPRHWELQRDLQKMVLGANALRDGDFEAAATRAEFIPLPKEEMKVAPEPTEPEVKNDPKDPKEKKPAKPIKSIRDLGAPITVLPGWSEQMQTLDAVELSARLIPSKVAKYIKPKRPKPKKDPYAPSNGLSTEPIETPEPTLGDAVLALEIRPKLILKDKDNTALPAPAALERTYLAVNSPAVRLQPGTWVRISAWVRLPGPILSSADGVLLFDSVGGEGMGVRLTDATGEWKRFRLYRQVPATGVMWVTAAITGIGTAYFDDLKIEPLQKGMGKIEE